MTTHASRQARRGFTLIEILIAIAIVAIMGAIVVPTFMSYRARAQDRAAKASIKAIQLQIESFRTDIGQYPESLKDLVKKPMNEDLAKNWVAPYLKEKDLNDPWGAKYQYHLTPEQENPYELYSYGPKGKSATQKERISVWDL